MITPNDAILSRNPFASFGLPSEKDLADWAQSYFPELNEKVNNGRYDDIAPSSFSPLVVPGTSLPSSGTSLPSSSFSSFDVNRIRGDFPILSERLSNGRQLIWLDNGATTQKPRQVINRISRFYERENSNVHRGAHELAARSTDVYEAARETIAMFLGAPSKDNIVYVRGTTEGINLVARSYVKPLLKQGDEIILTILEHHANIVPWQLVAQETGAVIKVAPVDDTG